jgi:hypothetical protein
MQLRQEWGSGNEITQCPYTAPVYKVVILFFVPVAIEPIKKPDRIHTISMHLCCRTD